MSVDFNNLNVARRVAQSVLAFANQERQKDSAFKLTEETLAKCLRPILAKEFPAGRTPMPKEERNALFDAFALSCGINPNEATNGIKRSIAVALADILSVSPDAKPNDFRDRAEAYRRKHRDWPLTCTSLAKYWGEFGSAEGRTVAAKGDVYQEPPGWKTNQKIKAAMKLSDGTWEVIAERNWFDLAVDIRSDILSALN